MTKLSRQLSIYDADEDLSMASADQRTTTGGLSGTQNSSQGPQISESASVPLMRKSLRNEYKIQIVQKQDENKTGNTKALHKLGEGGGVVWTNPKEQQLFFGKPSPSD